MILLGVGLVSGAPGPLGSRAAVRCRPVPRGGVRSVCSRRPFRPPPPLRLSGRACPLEVGRRAAGGSLLTGGVGPASVCVCSWSPGSVPVNFRADGSCLLLPTLLAGPGQRRRTPGPLSVSTAVAASLSTHGGLRCAQLFLTQALRGDGTHTLQTWCSERARCPCPGKTATCPFSS